ncbi:MAG: META domain-containing protein [Ferruginibacter sp.]|nr:META domain-containing protein [Ferruginibacter sp.]
MKKIILIFSSFLVLFLISCKCTKNCSSKGCCASSKSCGTSKSCCSKGGDAAKTLNGTWELTFITGPRIAFDGLYPDKKPQLTFNLPDSSVSGNTGCNSLNTVASIKESSISFTQPATTKMFCEGAGEPTFVKLLQEVDSYSHPDKNTLEFSGNKIVLMRFTKK